MTTGTDLADSLLDYALALSRERRVALAELPVIDLHGRVQLVRMLLGVGVPLWTMTTDLEGAPELHDEAALSTLRGLTEQLELEWMLPALGA
ncbi:hypothetical protein [Leifsonia sp. NPDC058248]|uniref:hypothetical protein n=1 Tax=Leifsonia sp. NPDC058248 TaxID=3346402 RepID=UPI0036DF9490